MSRHVLLVFLLIIVTGTESIFAATALQNQAARRELQEFVNRTNNRLRSLEEAQVNLLNRIGQLEDENRKLRSELAKARRDATTSTTEKDLKSLAKDIQAVDNNRVKDNKLIREEIQKILKAVNAAPSPQPATPAAQTTFKPDPNKFDYFEYAIADGDNLYVIQRRLRDEQNIAVKVKDIQDANPNVNWRKLKINQVILIPIPK